MHINYRQSQFELFPQTLANHQKVNRPAYLFSSLTLSLENIIIVAIILIMAVLFSFSLGVEKGKKIVTNPNDSLNQNNAPSGTEFTGRENKPSNRIKSLQLDHNQAIVEQVSAKPVPDKTIPVLKQMPLEAKGVVKSAYTVQVASYKQEKYAQKEAMNLKKTGHEIFVLPKGSHSIVCVGKFSSQTEANNALSRLRSKYKDCLVRRL